MNKSQPGCSPCATSRIVLGARLGLSGSIAERLRAGMERRRETAISRTSPLRTSLGWIVPDHLEHVGAFLADVELIEGGFVRVESDRRVIVHRCTELEAAQLRGQRSITVPALRAQAPLHALEDATLAAELATRLAEGIEELRGRDSETQALWHLAPRAWVLPATALPSLPDRVIWVGPAQIAAVESDPTLWPHKEGESAVAVAGMIVRGCGHLVDCILELLDGTAASIPAAPCADEVVRTLMRSGLVVAV